MTIPNNLTDLKTNKLWHPIWDYDNGWYLLIREGSNEWRQVTDSEVKNNYKGEHHIELACGNVGVKVPGQN